MFALTIALRLGEPRTPSRASAVPAVLAHAERATCVGVRPGVSYRTLAADALAGAHAPDAGELERRGAYPCGAPARWPRSGDGDGVREEGRAAVRGRGSVASGE